MWKIYKWESKIRVLLSAMTICKSLTVSTGNTRTCTQLLSTCRPGAWGGGFTQSKYIITIIYMESIKRRWYRETRNYDRSLQWATLNLTLEVQWAWCLGEGRVTIIISHRIPLRDILFFMLSGFLWAVAICYIPFDWVSNVD